MSTTRRIMGVFVCLAALCLGPALSGARAQTPEQPQQAGALDVLWAQNSGTGADNSLSSNLPNLTGGAASAQAADDFVVVLSNNQAWNIQQVTVSGLYGQGGSPTIDQVVVRLYEAVGGVDGLPAAFPFTYQNVSAFSSAPNFVLPVNLTVLGSPAGKRYWLSVQANITSSQFSIWNWLSSSASGGAAEGASGSAWIETTDSNQRPTYLNGGTCAGVWGKRLNCIAGSDNTRPNLAFQLDGQVVSYSAMVFMPAVRK